MADTDDLIAELEAASQPIETPDGIELPNATPDDDEAPKTDKRRRPWSNERREKAREAQRKRREREAAGGPRRVNRRSSAKLAQEIGGGLTKAFAIAGSLIATKDPYAGSVIIRRSDALGDAWGKLAAANPKIARYLDIAQKTGVYGEALIVTASVVLPIMANRGMFPAFITAQIMGAFDPDVAMTEATTNMQPATPNPAPNVYPH